LSDGRCAAAQRGVEFSNSNANRLAGAALRRSTELTALNACAICLLQIPVAACVRYRQRRAKPLESGAGRTAFDIEGQKRKWFAVDF
jgi:hypothetical protein